MQKRKKVDDTRNVAANNNNKSVETEIGLKQSLIKTRNTIRKKFQDLHNEKQTLSERISQKYKPIIDPIKSLSNDNRKNIPEKDESTPIKSEIKNESDSIFKTAFPSYRRKLFVKPKKLSFESNNSAIDDMQVDNNDDVEENSVKQKIREQVKQISSADKDNVYGIRSHDGELYMGKDPIRIKSDNNQMNYYIKNKKFPVTPGLSDLLLMNNPPFYTNQDLKTYKDMLTLTNAHKKSYKSNGLIRRSKSSVKYNKIITQLYPEKNSSTKRKSKGNEFDESVEGRGVKWWQQQQLKKPQTAYKTFNKSGVYDYKYWDNPNELVDRLRLLVSSQTAGHTGHNNEIIAIIEELREAKIIV